MNIIRWHPSPPDKTKAYLISKPFLCLNLCKWRTQWKKGVNVANTLTASTLIIPKLSDQRYGHHPWSLVVAFHVRLPVLSRCHSNIFFERRVERRVGIEPDRKCNRQNGTALGVGVFQ